MCSYPTHIGIFRFNSYKHRLTERIFKFTYHFLHSFLIYPNFTSNIHSNACIMNSIKKIIPSYHFRTGWIISMMLLSVNSLWAQSDILDQYIQEGIKSNLSLKQRNLSYAQSVAALREAKSLFLPRVSFNASYTLAGGGRNIAIPIGDLVNPVYATLNQLTGENSFPTDIPNSDEQFLPNDFHDTKFRLIQPLFDSDILFNYRSRQNLQLAESAQRDAYTDELTKDIQVAYFQYLQTESVLNIYEETQPLLVEILRVNKRLVENDKATYDAISSAQFQLSELNQNLAIGKRDVELARTYFNFLLNKELELPITIDSSFVFNSDVQALEAYEEMAVGQRKELSQLDYALQANEQNVSLRKFQILPKVNAVLDVGYQGFGYTFDSDQDYWLAQFSLSWDLFTGFGNKAREQQAVIEQQKLQIQKDELALQIQLQVKEAFYNLEAAERGVEAARDGWKQSGDVFRLTNRKYQEDQASLLELLEARTDYTQARINLAVRTYEYYIRRVELAWASGNAQTFIQP